MNKTGTTSLHYEFNRLGFNVGNQYTSESLFDEYQKGSYDNFFKYCNQHTFFQDIPFSIPKFYKILDNKFPNSKYILTIRNSADEWYDSLIRFHSMTSHIESNGKIPTSDDLKNSKYIRLGWLFDVHTTIFNTPIDEPYNRNILINTYNNHINDVIDYFKNRPDDLLVLNLGKPNSYTSFKKFIGVNSRFDQFLHKNKSK
jgi:hypothetical protein